MHRVLITGAGGGIGRALRETLRGVYPVLRLSDRVALAPARDGEEVDRTEIADMAAVEQMVAGVDGIIHLGGNSGEAEWDVILQSNIVGLYNVFEAARRVGVKRIVMATSNHAVGFYPRAQTIDHRVVPRPDSRYGVSKAFSEALASLYSDKHGIGFLCVRIGNFGTQPIDRRRLSIWISPRDLTQLVRIGLDHPDLRYEIVYGVSNNRRSWYDNANAHRLGYRPQDDSSRMPKRCWRPSRRAPTRSPSNTKAAPSAPYTAKTRAESASRQKIYLSRHGWTCPRLSGSGSHTVARHSRNPVPLKAVMAELVPAIYVSGSGSKRAWITGTSPVMTIWSRGSVLHCNQVRGAGQPWSRPGDPRLWVPGVVDHRVKPGDDDDSGAEPFLTI